MPSVRELITADIQTVLNTITIANGYDNDLSGWAIRLDMTEDDYTLPMAMVWFGGEEKRYDQSDALTCEAQYGIRVVMRDGTASLSTVLDSYITDLERALMVDATRGGRAIDTLLRGHTVFEPIDDESTHGAIVDVAVRYRHDIEDPRVVA